MKSELFLNKAGEERLLSIWWFAILMIVGLGIVVGALIFFSDETDVRQAESQILYEHLANCLIDQGFVDVDKITNENFDIFEYCSLDKEVFENSKDVWYFEIKFYGSLGEEHLIYQQGAESIKDGCFIQLGIEKDSSLNEKDIQEITHQEGSKCIYQSESVSYYSNREDMPKILKGKLQILASSNQKGKKTTAEN
ncbi:MAG: hypothetical protein ACOCUU_01495 [Nanoarchaeota archaeon]